jgi:tetratricopeptide (TPR) repeat protein
MAFNLGKFADALTDYQAAYEAKPLPGFLFNIAQCYRNMGNYERARFFYRRYLALEPRTSNRRLVEDLIAEMTRLLDKQAEEKAAAPPAASSPPAPSEDKPVAVALASTAPPPLAPSPAAAPQGALVASPEGEAPPSRPLYTRWWFWTVVGAAVAGGVVAGFLLTRNDSPKGSLAPIDGR